MGGVSCGVAAQRAGLDAVGVGHASSVVQPLPPCAGVGAVGPFSREARRGVRGRAEVTAFAGGRGRGAGASAMTRRGLYTRGGVGVGVGFGLGDLRERPCCGWTSSASVIAPSASLLAGPLWAIGPDVMTRIDPRGPFGEGARSRVGGPVQAEEREAPVAELRRRAGRPPAVRAAEYVAVDRLAARGSSASYRPRCPPSRAAGPRLAQAASQQAGEFQRRAPRLIRGVALRYSSRARPATGPADHHARPVIISQHRDRRSCRDVAAPSDAVAARELFRRGVDDRHAARGTSIAELRHRHADARGPMRRLPAPMWRPAGTITAAFDR